MTHVSKMWFLLNKFNVNKYLMKLLLIKFTFTDGQFLRKSITAPQLLPAV